MVETSRFKKILSSVCVALLLASVLAVSSFALDVSTEISRFYFSVNGSAYMSCGNTVSGALITGNPDNIGNVTISSYSFLIPFSLPCDAFTFSVGMWTGSVGSYGTYTADWGTLAGGKFWRSGSVPVTYSSGMQESYKYALAPESTNCYRLSRYYTFDLSSVDATGGANYFVRLSFSDADFPLRTHLKASTGWTRSGSATFTSNVSELPSYARSTPGESYTLKATSALKGKISISPQRVWNETNDLAPITLSAMRNSNDRDAVAQLQKINGTLDGMAANLKSITDDFKAREDVGGNISGVTSDDQISNGTSGMTTGSSSISSSISSLPSFSSVIAPATGYISFLTSPVQSIFDFGNGYLLYIATVMVLLSVIFWIIKRMGGDS